AELLEQITQQAPRCRYRLQRIERIIEAAVVGRLRHELRDAERAGRADHVRSETAFLIEQTNEKMRRQIVAMRGLSERVADFLARAVNDWLEKGMKCLQWQYDSFVAGRQISFVIVRLFARRLVACYGDCITRCERQPTTDKCHNDAGENVAGEAESRSPGHRAKQPARHGADHQTDEKDDFAREIHKPCQFQWAIIAFR